LSGGTRAASDDVIRVGVCVRVCVCVCVCVCVGGRSSLLALVGVGLGHGLGQLHLKLVAAQRHLLVVGDEREERVEHQVVRQVELGAARLLPGVDAAMLHAP